MAAICQTTILAFFITYFTINAAKQLPIPIPNRIKYRQSKLYKNFLQKWEFELDNKLEYPGNDKEKLYQISALWSEYYACSSRLARSAAAAVRLPAAAVAAYEGAIARLPCGLCIAPGVTTVQWNYQKHESAFTPIIMDDRKLVAEDGNLTVFKVRKEDAGVYKCTIGHSAGGIVILYVVDPTEIYNVVKPPTSRGPYPASDQSIRFADSSLQLFTSWAPWSECSVCGHVGRKRRYGMCYVKTSRRIEDRSNDISTTPVELDFKTANQLKVFKAGIPCRSRLLPMRIRSTPAVAQRRNEIMIGLCKVPCENVTVFEVRSSNGALLESANNTAGVYSLTQRLPTDPPPPVCETIFATRGQKLILICPGTSLRDIPFTWRVGTKQLVPREVDKTSGGRVHLNARDGIYFAEITYADANLYSCWQRHVLVGTVRLSVWDVSPWWRRAWLLATLLAAALVLRALDAILRQQRRRGMRQVT